MKMMASRIYEWGVNTFLLLLMLMVNVIVAKDIKILNLSWMLVNGTTLASETVVTSSILVPLAIKHWNERYDGILRLSQLRGNCQNTLSLVEGKIIDSGNSPNQAMKAILYGDRLTNVDIIYGPMVSKVSYR
jgi:hypothetical protein